MLGVFAELEMILRMPIWPFFSALRSATSVAALILGRLMVLLVRSGARQLGQCGAGAAGRYAGNRVAHQRAASDGTRFTLVRATARLQG
jgi:hypothetical protein